ncbi:MAG TPA: hypothetical protein VFW40_04455, partial [Capsulimonadaceae bacterium]|nr:hypothetical protein [Capsulimonadaceae bacterium]
LVNQSITNDRLPDMLYQQTGEGGSAVLAANGTASSPWMVVQPGVIARFTNTGGYLRTNLLELRILPAAARAGGGLLHTAADATDAGAGPTLGGILGTDGSQSNLIGYPIGQASQAPLITPQLPLPYIGIRG